MWLPCNFGEKIRMRPFMKEDYTEVELVGLTIGIPYQDGAPYVFEFKDNRNTLHAMSLYDKIAYWPHAFNNPDSYDEKSLNCGEIDLIIYPNDAYHKYNRYFFNSKSSAEGRCISIIRQNDGYKYTFSGHDGLHKCFIIDDLLVNKPFGAYADDPILQ